MPDCPTHKKFPEDSANRDYDVFVPLLAGDGLPPEHAENYRLYAISLAGLRRLAEARAACERLHRHSW